LHKKKTLGIIIVFPKIGNQRTSGSTSFENFGGTNKEHV
jgi:hypothetical protein